MARWPNLRLFGFLGQDSLHRHFCKIWYLDYFFRHHGNRQALPWVDYWMKASFRSSYLNRVSSFKKVAFRFSYVFITISEKHILMWCLNVCVCAALCLLITVALHSIPMSSGGSELLDAVERLSKEMTCTKIPYSQAWSVFMEDKEISSYPFNQTACKCQAPVISLVTEICNFSFKPIMSFRRHSHSCTK